ncbi:MAG: ABC transporter ATP-binding protein [Ilumatobacteraceae bacterium]
MNTRIGTRETDDPLLEVEDLHTTFTLGHGSVRAVDGVSLTLHRGKTLGVVGESGSGKTVLSRTIMGLNTASNVTISGSVRYAGEELVGRPSKHLRSLFGPEMAMVFQDPMTSLNPVVKVGRQLTEHVRYHLGLGKSEAEKIAIALLTSVRIPEPEARLDAYPHQMSGGMRQRVCIAMALACGPRLLFADEPTTALDVTVQHQILNLLAEQQRDRAMGMVLVTHDLGVVAGRTDEIVVMYAGRVVERAPTTTLFAEMRHPYTEGLLRSIPKTSEAKHTRLNAIHGRPPDLLSPPPGCKFAPRCPYAQERCRNEEPPLTDPETPGHSFRCFYPIGTPENRAAYESNLAAGLPQTLAAAGQLLATEEVA